MTDQPAAAGSGEPGAALLALYDSALPSVYGYLLSRCRSRGLAEDLTSETFLAAVDQVRREPPRVMSTGWLVGVARHKLADHWRRRAREERNLRAVLDLDEGPAGEDPWDAQLDVIRAREVLASLPSHHRSALTLRYVDDLPVNEVAELMHRTVHATEGILVRARRAFRAAYEEGVAHDA